MKVESRGKFPGVKLHLEPEEVQVILNGEDELDGGPYAPELGLISKIRKKVLKLLKETPGLLEARTPEEITAILIKEAEKSAAQLAHVKAGGQLKDLDKEALKKKLLSYVEDK